LQALQAWRRHAVRAWTEGPEPWFGLSRKIAARLAFALGAAAEDVLVGESTTINLHQILATFYKPRSGMPRILIDSFSFPTDRYAVASHLHLRGRDPAHDLVVVGGGTGFGLAEEALALALDGTVGLAVLPAMVFTSGQLLALTRLTRLARDRGALVAWD